MLLNLLEYHWVEDVDDALMLLSRPDMKTVPLAGGTHLLGLKDESIQAVVDLRDLALSYVSEDAKDIHIGAMLTLQEMIDAPQLKELAGGVLSKAAFASSSSRLIRNSATLGGTLAIGADSQADLLTALAVLDTQVVLRSGSKSSVNLAPGTFDRPGFALSGVTYKGKQERRVSFATFNENRSPNELIIEVVIPQPPYASSASFMRIANAPTATALLNTAAFIAIADGKYQQVRFAFGGVGMQPLRLLKLENQLEGQPVNTANNSVDVQRLLDALQASMADLQLPPAYCASSAYRRISGRTLAFRTLEEAISVARWRSMARRNQSNPYGR